jgi:hypothetical protein
MRLDSETQGGRTEFKQTGYNVVNSKGEIVFVSNNEAKGMSKAEMFAYVNGGGGRYDAIHNMQNAAFGKIDWSTQTYKAPGIAEPIHHKAAANDNGRVVGNADYESYEGGVEAIDEMDISYEEKLVAKEQLSLAMEKLRGMSEVEIKRMINAIGSQHKPGILDAIGDFFVPKAEAAVPILIAGCLSNPACLTALTGISIGVAGAAGKLLEAAFKEIVENYKTNSYNKPHTPPQTTHVNTAGTPPEDFDPDEDRPHWKVKKYDRVEYSDRYGAKYYRDPKATRGFQSEGTKIFTSQLKKWYNGALKCIQYEFSQNLFFNNSHRLLF